MRARILALVVIAGLLLTGLAALVYSLTRPEPEAVQAKPSAQLPMVDKADAIPLATGIEQLQHWS